MKKNHYFHIINLTIGQIKKIELPNSIDIIAALDRIIKAFESPIEIEVTKTRWEEIKKLQLRPIIG